MAVSVALLIIALIQVSVSSAAPTETSEELVTDISLESSIEPFTQSAEPESYDAGAANASDSNASFESYDAGAANASDSNASSSMETSMEDTYADKESDMREALTDLLTIVQELAKKLGRSVEDILGDMELSESQIHEILDLIEDGLSVGKLGLEECEELVRVLLEGVFDLSDFLLEHDWILNILLKVMLGELTGGVGFLPSIFDGGLEILERLLGI